MAIAASPNVRAAASFVLHEINKPPQRRIACSKIAHRNAHFAQYIWGSIHQARAIRKRLSQGQKVLAFREDV
jgi:hypothetical protein